VYHEVQRKFLWGIFTILAVSAAWTSHEIIWLFLLGGVPALLVRLFQRPCKQGALSRSWVLALSSIDLMFVEHKSTLLRYANGGGSRSKRSSRRGLVSRRFRTPPDNRAAGNETP